MTLTRAGRLALVSGAVAVLTMIGGTAGASAGTGWDITLDSARLGRFVSGGANYAISQSPSPGHVLVEFECGATSGYDSTQTRVLPWWENGCVLYKGSTVVHIADGQSLPGPAAATHGTATVDLNIEGPFQVCWNVAATFAANGGDDLSNSGCTSVNAPDPISTLEIREFDPNDYVDLSFLKDLDPGLRDWLELVEPARP